MGIPSSDTAAITTIDGIVDTISVNVSNLAPVYGNQSVAPDKAAGKTATCSSSAWVLGAATSSFMTASSNTFIGIHVEQLSAEGTYQIDLFYGGSNRFCSAVFARIEHAVVDSVYIPIRSQQITGAITAKVASATGGSETMVLKLVYV